MAVMKIDDLSVTLGKRPILQGISLPELTSGQFVGLLGPNASGKSTLLKTIALGLRYEGALKVADREVSRIGRKERSLLISMMPQTPPIGSTLSPFELMRSYARATELGMNDKVLGYRMAELLNRLGLTPDAHRPLMELSGGKRQLVGLCLAMIREPAFLLLDEPTSALDLRWQLTALDVARDYTRSHNAVGIVALHDINLALRYCDTLAVLKNGRTAACGRPSDVVTPELLSDVYGVEARMETCSAGHPVLIADRPSTGEIHQQGIPA
ncbi:ABC transporter ATP-binding protein [uncultured Roseibium sp.]|uniref:ABC transporter ATP-binding protein n=1 Tax=uncultured Roseibium sp. TaxID=1936171 RepID=UPI0032170D3D